MYNYAQFKFYFTNQIVNMQALNNIEIHDK